MGAIKLRHSTIQYTGPMPVVLALCAQLFTHEDAFIDRQILELTQLLGREMNKTLHGFFFMNRRWIPSCNIRVVQATGIKATIDIPAVPVSMLAEFLNFQKSIDTLTQEKQEIRQTIFTVVSRCSGTQELRDALPESLAQLLPVVLSDMPDMATHFPRQRPPLWNLNPAMKAQFEAAMPRIDAYLVSKMFM